MVVRWLVAAVHLLALGIGMGAIAGRALALRGPLDAARLKSVLLADSLWGVAALLWISTGLWRAFGGLEKGTAYYLGSTAFWIKMALLGAILLLEVRPMIGLIRWRIARAKGVSPDLGGAQSFARISMLQLVLLIAMVFVATAMARGIGI